MNASSINVIKEKHGGGEKRSGNERQKEWIFRDYKLENAAAAVWQRVWEYKKLEKDEIIRRKFWLRK